MADSIKPRRSWWPRLVRLAVFTALAALLAHYAHTRLTTQPPVAVENLYDAIPRTWTPPPNDATADVRELMNALSQRIVFKPPAAPAGMTWNCDSLGYPPVLDILDALVGEWVPSERPHLRAVIAQLESEATRDRIARLRALRDRSWHFDVWSIFTTDTTAFRDLRATVKLLAADARYQHAHRGDVEGAWQDLKTSLWLAESLPPESLISVLVRDACHAPALRELGHMTLEHDMDTKLAAEMDRVIAALAPASELWLGAVAGEEAFLRATIDATFTRDANGDGWLVPSSDARLYNKASARGGDIGNAPLWNLTSCFYNDRRRVEEKVRRYAARLRGLLDQSFGEDTGLLDRMITAPPPFNPCDGRHLYESEQVPADLAYTVLVAAEARRNAVRVMVALARYRAASGEYPTTLSSLVPAYISALPPDPFGAPSLGYVRTASDEFQLYSIGGNGQDNGGTAGSGRPGRYTIEDGDFLFIVPRGGPYSEPKLVPATPSQGAGSDAHLSGDSTGE